MSELVKVSKEFGRALIKEAEVKTIDEIRDGVVEATKRIMADRELALEWKERNRKAAHFCAHKLEAIEKGKFEIVKKQIFFKDEELNASMSAYVNRIP